MPEQIDHVLDWMTKRKFNRYKDHFLNNRIFRRNGLPGLWFVVKMEALFSQGTNKFSATVRQVPKEA
jgi:hypothetical protein